MRVALVAPLFESVPPRLYGGTERVVYNLCRGLKRTGIEATLFASGDSRVDCRLVPMIDEALRLRKARPYDPAAFNFGMLTQLRDLADKFDLIHNHHDFWMFPLSDMVRVPFLSTLHGRLDPPELMGAYNFPNAHFVSISDSQRQPMPGLNWIRTIHHGIDASEFEFHPQPGKYLAFLGRITVEKRPEWAIEIAKQSGVPLKIAAKIEGPESQAYYDALVRPHIDGKFIEYVGEISEAEKSDFLGNALATVFPIDWPEPFGLVIIESLACGTPVLARPCGAAPELLRDGVTGYSHREIGKLAMRVQSLPSLDRLRCRRWVEEKFSIQRMTEDYIDAYKYVTEYAVGIRTDSYRRNFLYPVKRVADGNS